METNVFFSAVQSALDAHIERMVDARLKEILTTNKAYEMSIDNHLGVTGKVFEELCALAQRDRGWNDLCGRIQEHAERIAQDNEDLRRQYHECEAIASREDEYAF